MKKNNLKIITEVAIFAAIAVVLDLIQGGIFRGIFPSGGSIGIAIVPVFIISYRRGFKYGLLCGLIVSLLKMLGGVYSVSGDDFVLAPFIQIMLDYVLAYTVLGFAGLFRNMFKNAKKNSTRYIAVISGCLLGGLLKYSCNVISGGLFWLGDGTSSFMNVSDDSWLYSFVYNGAYCIPNIIIAIIILVIFVRYYSFILIADDEFKIKGEKNEKGNL